MGQHQQRRGVASIAAAAAVVISATVWGLGAGTDTAAATDPGVTPAATSSPADHDGASGPDRDADGIVDGSDREPDNPYSPGDQDGDGDVDLADARNEEIGGPGSSAQQPLGAADSDHDGVSDYRDSDPEDPSSPGDRDHDGDVDNNDAFLARQSAAGRTTTP